MIYYYINKEDKSSLFYSQVMVLLLLSNGIKIIFQSRKKTMHFLQSTNEQQNTPTLILENKSLKC